MSETIIEINKNTTRREFKIYGIHQNAIFFVSGSICATIAYLSMVKYIFDSLQGSGAFAVLNGVFAVVLWVVMLITSNDIEMDGDSATPSHAVNDGKGDQVDNNSEEVQE